MKYIHYFGFIFIFLLYALFPTSNSVSDAYNYAGFVRFGEFLWDPHHLLYTPFLQLVQHLSPFDPLSTGKLMNALFATLSLIVLYTILSQVQRDKTKRLLCVVLVAFSYCTIRFATENETYIIPIFFSLLASFFYIRSIQVDQKISSLVFSSFFGIIAILFHQIHLFWWLGLFIGLFLFQRKSRTIIAFLFPTFIPPFIYFAVYHFTQFEASFIEFLAHDYFSGSATTKMSAINFILTPISLVRSFIQVHEVVWLAIKEHWMLAVMAILSCFALFMAIIHLFRRGLSWKSNAKQRPVFMTHLIIFILQLGFAFFSVGNAEFMVMFPYLLLIICIGTVYFSKPLLVYLTTFFVLWNGTFGLFLPHFWSYKGYEQFERQFHMNSDHALLITNDLDYRARYYYHHGNRDNILMLRDISSIAEFDTKIQQYQSVFTTINGQPTVFNRREMTRQIEKGPNYLNNYDQIEAFEYDGLYGTFRVYELVK